VFDVKSGVILRKWEIDEADDFSDYEVFETVAFSPGGKLVAAANDKGAIRIFDLRTKNKERTIRIKDEILNSYRILSIRFSPNSKLLASVSTGFDSVTGPIYGEIKLWDVRTGNLVLDLPPERCFIWSVAFSPNGKLLATANEDGTVKIWDLKKRSLKQILTGYEGAIYSAAFTTDGHNLVTGSEDKTIRVWNTNNWTLKRQIKGHKDKVISIAISSQGKLVSGGAGDKTVRTWEIRTGRMHSVRKINNSINTVAISPDGKWLASGTSDGELIIWEDK
jgi:WD40 repeat protein